MGWIVVDLSRCKMEKKEYQGSGCDDKSSHFFTNTIPIYLTQYSSESCHSKWGIAIASSKTLKISFLHGFLLRRLDWGYFAACMLCSMLFSLLC